MRLKVFTSREARLTLVEWQQRAGAVTPPIPVEDIADLYYHLTLDHAQSREARAGQLQRDLSVPDATAEGVRDLLLLQEAAAVLASLASGPDTLPTGAATDRALDQVEQALTVLRRALTHRPH